MAHDRIIVGDRGAGVGVGDRRVDRLFVGDVVDELGFVLDNAPRP